MNGNIIFEWEECFKVNMVASELSVVEPVSEQLKTHCRRWHIGLVGNGADIRGVTR